MARGFGAVLPAALIGIGLLVWDIPLCPLKNFFGVPCPGCGMTRAARALFQLDVAEALVLHPLVLLVVPMVVWFVIRTALVHGGLLGRDRFDLEKRLPRGVWVFFAVALFGTWVVRLVFGWHPDPIGFRFGAAETFFGHWG